MTITPTGEENKPKYPALMAAAAVGIVISTSSCQQQQQQQQQTIYAGAPVLSVQNVCTKG